MNTSNSTLRWVISIIIVVLLVIGLVVLVEHYSSTTVPVTTTTGTGSTTTTTTTTTISTASSTAGEQYGLSQYVDQTYGFSFWYPSAEKVTVAALNDSTSFPGAVSVQSIQIGDQGGTELYVVNSPAGTITDEPNGHASPISQTKYIYSTTTGAWLVAYPEGTETGSSAATTTADISRTTISGLYMLPSGRRFDSTIIPLSPTRFVVVGDGGGSSYTSALAQTITLLGSTISVSTQTNALEAEAASVSQND